MARGKNLTTTEIADICLRVDNGENKKTIAKEYGISFNRVVRCYTAKTVEQSAVAMAEIIETPDTSSDEAVAAMAVVTRDAAIKEIFRRLTAEEWRNRIKPNDLVQIVNCMNSIATTNGKSNISDAIDLIEKLRNKASITYITDNGKED